MPNRCMLSGQMIVVVVLVCVSLASVITYTLTSSSAVGYLSQSSSPFHSPSLQQRQGGGELGGALVAATEAAAAAAASARHCTPPASSVAAPPAFDALYPPVNVSAVTSVVADLARWASSLAKPDWRTDDVLIVLPDPSEPTDWSIVDSLPVPSGRPPFASLAEFDEWKMKASGSVTEDMLTPLPTVRSQWGRQLGNEYMGNTKMGMASFVVDGITIIIKRSDRPQPVLHTDKIEPIMRLVNECGFHKIVAQHWVDKWQGVPTMFAVVSPGVTVELGRGRPAKVYPPHTRTMFANIPSWQVRLMALYDMLFSYTDRHYGNILVDEQFNIYSIDAFQNTLGDNPLAVNSILLPFTSKYGIHRLSFEFLFKNMPMPTYDDPTVTLDYRCHTPGGRIGVVFPPPLRSCMADLASADPPDLVARYGFPKLAAAETLVDNARSLLIHGFEATAFAAANRSLHSNPKEALQPWLSPSQPCCLLIGNWSTVGRR
ncbi:uncharacterized protein AMSG_10260 [Thecamonas trahens ATCC 50062]|uniref:PI3K/PI4K catalytic domain-containing protein n=1 Tax=Thecamonas trahens ATCC 50062 TaxID=461836 RepID=A0A0L0DQH6_THETB|nr:hypothetical protein AMSG_10260 [Thecamonas trahens ATCC 50062]KNC54281.1 hypothetical protein AMSG_10260 [Thecamonas trahens ATCC 50062]|eukprot:XP_013753746.1 hypothetical protein AMSG_10260 [Thecamonas trahens ATCC 50062]